MHTVSDISNPRHARLFELIRQQNQAETTVARLNGMTIRKITVDEMDQMQRMANQSLRTRPQSRAQA